MKTTIAVAFALVVGAIVGSTWTNHQRDDKELELRSHWARALFRVAERHVGHQRLIVEWREEAKLHDPEDLPSTME
jgi:hypothetical protein